MIPNLSWLGGGSPSSSQSPGIRPFTINRALVSRSLSALGNCVCCWAICLAASRWVCSARHAKYLHHAPPTPAAPEPRRSAACGGGNGACLAFGFGQDALGP